MSAKRRTDVNYSAALYMRLSKDDENTGESGSIINQRKMLRAYAKEHRYMVYDEYIDDGVSGTTFDRPGFKRMIQDIEKKKVNLVLTKDLSRLGRDHIMTGQYTELYFPSKRVRYIAVNDGYDSDSPYTDIAPFKNVINEMVARDTSKKIRSSFETRMREGDFVGAKAPYGYQRDPQDKHHLIVDEPAAEIVREMFQSAAKGVLPKQIADHLNAREVPSPAVYHCMKHPNWNLDAFSKRKEWTSSSITKMLRNIVYLGHMVQGKTTKLSFKSNIILENPECDWLIVRNTHEPLVSQETFELAARRSKQRTCHTKGTFRNVFSGIAKCADCGRNMSTVGTRKKGARANLACGGYKLYGSKECTNHFIDYDVLYGIVLDTVKELVCISQGEREELLRDAKECMGKDQKNDSTKEIKRLEKRNRQLDGMIEQLYEDHGQGLIQKERLQKMVGKYEAESRQITDRIEALKSESQNEKQQPVDEKLEQLLQEYTDVKELNPELLYRLIDHIEIGQGHYEKGKHGKVKRQSVKIWFRFRGAPVTKEYEI